MRTVGATGAEGRTGASRSAADEEEEEGDVASSSRPRFEPAPAPAAMGAALFSPSSISIRSAWAIRNRSTVSAGGAGA